MKAFLFFCTVFLCCGIAGAQQTKFLFAAHGIYGLPQNDFRNASSYSIGGDATVGLGQRSTMFTGTVGLQSFKGKNSTPNTRFVPLLLGARQSFNGGFFVNGNAGLAFLRNAGTSASRFMMEGGIGLRILSLDLMVNYGGFNNPFPNAGGWVGYWSFKIGGSIIK